MVYAIITAAGKGTRANLGVPKQFFEVDGKPLIWYTINAFEKVEAVDAIVLLLDSYYFKNAEEFFKKFNFTKPIYFVEGGCTNQESIFNGLIFLKDIANENDIIVIHDGVRCLVSETIIKSNLEICKKYGNAITAVHCNEAMLLTEDAVCSKESINRDEIMKTQTPHSILFGHALSLFEKAKKQQINNSVALCTLLIEFGETVYFSKGSSCNFKITTPDDISLFEGIIYAKNKK